MTWHRPVRIARRRVRRWPARPRPTCRARAVRRGPASRSSASTRRPCSKARAAVLQQVRENEEHFEVKAERTLHYEDGSTRLYGMRLSVRNRSGRDFIVTAKEAQRGQEAKDLELTGDVAVWRPATASAGRAERDLQPRSQGRAGARCRGLHEGPADGLGVGHVLRHEQRVLTLLAEPDVRLSRPDATGAGDAVPRGRGVLDRFSICCRSRNRRTRGSRQPGDRSRRRLARLSEDEQRVSLVELRGRRPVKGRRRARGMTAPRHGLAYAEDGETLQRAVLTADAQVVGRRRGRRAAAAGQRRRPGPRARRGGRGGRAQPDATAWCRPVQRRGAQGSSISARSFDATNGPSGGRCRTCGSATTWNIASGAGRTRRAGPRAAACNCALADDAVSLGGVRRRRVVRGRRSVGGRGRASSTTSRAIAWCSTRGRRTARSRLADDRLSLTAHHIDVGLENTRCAAERHGADRAAAAGGRPWTGRADASTFGAAGGRAGRERQRRAPVIRGRWRPLRLHRRRDAVAGRDRDSRRDHRPRSGGRQPHGQRAARGCRCR